MNNLLSKISAAERAKRLAAVNFARGSVRLEGVSRCVWKALS